MWTVATVVGFLNDAVLLVIEGTALLCVWIRGFVRLEGVVGFGCSDEYVDGALLLALVSDEEAKMLEMLEADAVWDGVV